MSNTLTVSRLNTLFVSNARPYLLTTIAREIETGKTTLHDLHEESPARTVAEATKYARRLLRDDKKDAYDQIKGDMPQFLPAVVSQYRNADAIDAFSGLVCLEFDDPDVDTAFAFAQACQNPHVLMAWRSLSVKPKILVRVDMTSVDDEPLTVSTFPHAWVSASQLFEDIGAADTSASNPLQPQNICYDPDLYINTGAIPLDWSVDTEALKAEMPEIFDALTFSLISDLPQEYIDAFSQMEYSESGIGKARVPCPFGGNHEHDGWGFRSNGTRVIKHGDNDFTLQCFKCPKSKRYNANAENPFQKQKLQHNASTEAKPLETLEQNRENRATATDDFLSQDSELLYIQLVRDFTGTGKSYTTLAKAKQHGKRIIVNPPHTDLALQAVETAYELGFKNPYHLVGREQNWDASGIAEIPIQDRTADLFAKNNCIMVDVIRAYTDKRLAPRTYCETRCEFREGCVYLSQYEGLDDRDFLTTCTPNLLFDLNMRGFLVSLVTSSSEPTDEELAIDAILGTTSEATNDFDFAILDDYGISALYWDVAFKASEFNTLKKVWKGTPTGAFAKGILKAFKKEKPSHIFKALRKAFTESEEHHAEIAKHLTQHARQGVIEYLDVPKGSAETERLLTEKRIVYTDGGTQFIPVDFEAYQELTDKNLPTVHPSKLPTNAVGDSVTIPHAPQKALSAGLSLDDLTPVWQAGATPIELLRLLIDSVGKPKNAPIHLDRGVIHFTLPPQAPVGLLPHIAMLSATSQIQDAKRSFQGQAVTFSEHTGNPVQWADRVEVYQYQDARLTSASVFEYPKGADGKRLLQEKPTGLKPTAEKRIAKLNDWAKEVDGVTAFISFKEFTDIFTEAVNGFDIVTHFDKVAGLNFDGLKYLVVFGYPKVKHEDVIKLARKQYASDSEPLPSGSYDELTHETEYQADGYTILERRYTDNRLESIRHQLATEKIEQAIGRARLPFWTDTQTILFTDAPITGITERATLFSESAFNLAESPSGIVDATEQIADAEQNGDVQAVMETQGVSERTAYTRTKDPRKQRDADRDARIIELHKAGTSQREIERIMKREGYQVSLGTINSKITAFRNCNL